jgi:hypothetical protein
MLLREKFRQSRRRRVGSSRLMSRDEPKAELFAIILELDALVHAGWLPKCHAACSCKRVNDWQRRGDLHPQPPHQYPDDQQPR